MERRVFLLVAAVFMIVANAVMAAEKTAYAVYCGRGETPTFFL